MDSKGFNIGFGTLPTDAYFQVSIYHRAKCFWCLLRFVISLNHRLHGCHCVAIYALEPCAGHASYVLYDGSPFNPYKE